MKHLQAVFSIVSAAPILFLIGLAISFGLFIAFPTPIFVSGITENLFLIIGMVMILLGTILAFFSQRVSRKLFHPQGLTCNFDFAQGTYKYSRHPGTLAMFIMYVGLVFVTNSLIMMILAIVFVLGLTFIFIPLQEKALVLKCGQSYVDYQKQVRMWF